MAFPYENFEVDANLTKEILTYFKGTPKEYVRLGPNKYLFYKIFETEASKVYEMKVRPDDVWIITLPRSGTTVTQELIWQVMHDMDFKTADEIPITVRFPDLLVSSYFDNELLEKIIAGNPNEEERLRKFKNSSVDIIANMSGPRSIKSHLPLSLSPPGLLDEGKVIYIARDPRDVAVSYYHFCKLFKSFQFEGEFKTFWQLFVDGNVPFLPYFEHVKEAWQKRSHPNMLFLFYEEIIKDMPSTVTRIASFLNKKFSDEQVTKLADRLCIDKFRKNLMVNYELGRCFQNEGETFIRKGKAGGWRDYFDEEMTLQAEEWIKANLKDTDLRFPLYLN